MAYKSDYVLDYEIVANTPKVRVTSLLDTHYQYYFNIDRFFEFFPSYFYMDWCWSNLDKDFIFASMTKGVPEAITDLNGIQLIDFMNFDTEALSDANHSLLHTLPLYAKEFTEFAEDLTTAGIQDTVVSQDIYSVIQDLANNKLLALEIALDIKLNRLSGVDTKKTDKRELTQLRLDKLESLSPEETSEFIGANAQYYLITELHKLVDFLKNNIIPQKVFADD